MALRLFARGGSKWMLGGVASAAVGLALALGGAAQDANARPAGESGRAQAKAAQPGPILAVVSLARQRIWIWGSGGLLAESKVSTGMAGHRTPPGVFSVVQKNKFHRSNIYSDAPMPFMQRITWSGIALHAGVVPGYPASHGCIRLPHSFAVELWGMTRIGARVVIVPDDPSVFHIEHSRLPTPLLTPALDEGEPAKARVDASAVKKIADRPDEGAETAIPQPRLLTPMERAKAARAHAVADAPAKAKAARVAYAASAAKSAEAHKAIAAVRKAERVQQAAAAKRDAAAAAIDETAPPERLDRAKAALEAAETNLAVVTRALEEARAAEAAATPDALAAARAAWEAEQASTEAAGFLKSTERNSEPISIFVSKKAGRVYIRQAWAPIHEAPVTFEGPEAPVGTHLYLATATQEDARAMRWLAVSIPSSQAGAGEPADAVAALARFELSADTRQFIEDRLWAGASMIVSDEGISRETGSTTDFIVLPR